MEWSKKWHGDIVPLVVFDDGKRVIDGYDPKGMERVLKELDIKGSR